MKQLTIFYCSIIAVFLAGCSSTTVIPQSGNIFTVTTSRQRPYVGYSCINKANNVCEQQGSDNVNNFGSTNSISRN